MTFIEEIASHIKNPKFISITGAGGKTSLMKALAQYYKKAGKSVLMTTTTKIQNPLFFNWGADFKFSDELAILQVDASKPVIALFGKEFMDIKKWQAPRMEMIGALSRKFDVVICEADGARQLPMKYHTDRDPVIHPETTCTIAVMGLWAIGNPACDQVCGWDTEEMIDKSFLDDYVCDEQGIMKGNPDIIVLNGTDIATEKQLQTAQDVDWPNDVIVIEGSVQENSFSKCIMH